MTVLYTNQDYHDEITWFFDTYYAVKKASENGDSIPVKDRITNADELIEQYVEQHGQRPPNAILSRLATYILLDTLSDSHPDKMSREEYPIMSRGQQKRRQRTHVLREDLPYGDLRYLGKRKVGSSMLTDDGNEKDDMPFVSEISLIPQRESEMDAEIERMNVRYIIENAGLTERELRVVELFLESGATQDEIASDLGVSQARVSQLMNAAIDKISESNSI